MTNDGDVVPDVVPESEKEKSVDEAPLSASPEKIKQSNYLAHLILTLKAIENCLWRSI